jgi:hypothetical protein
MGIAERRLDDVLGQVVLPLRDDQPGRPQQVFDFSEFADFPLLFRPFAGVFHRRTRMVLASRMQREEASQATRDATCLVCERQV